MPLSHFQSVFNGNGTDHLNFNIVGLPVGHLSEGDELALFDGESCVGAVTLTAKSISNEKVSIVASASDQGEWNGFTDGNKIGLKLWQPSTGVELELDPLILEGSDNFSKKATTIASLQKYSESGFSDLVSGEPQFICFPNPTSGIISICFDRTPENDETIQVFNSLGKKMLEKSDLFRTQQIDMSTWSQGVYYMKVGNNRSTKTIKLILRGDLN